MNPNLILGLLIIMVICLLYVKRESFSYPGDWSLGGYTMQKHGVDRTRIHRGPVAGGIIVSQVLPSMAHTYRVGDEIESCDLCPNCHVCPSCPQCKLNQ